MDWEGQKISELIMQYLLLGFACAAFLAGYVLSSYQIMLTTYVTGVCITFLFTVPEWPFFNRHPLVWSEAPPPGVLNSKLLRSRQAKQSAKPVAKK